MKRKATRAILLQSLRSSLPCHLLWHIFYRLNGWMLHSCKQLLQPRAESLSQAFWELTIYKIENLQLRGIRLTLDSALLQTAQGVVGSHLLFREKVLEMRLMSSLLPCIPFSLEAKPHISDDSCKENVGSDQWECRHLSKLLNQKKEKYWNTFMGHMSLALVSSLQRLMLFLSFLKIFNGM